MKFTKSISIAAYVACFAALPFQVGLAAPPNSLRVGASKVDITPTDLTNLNPMGRGTFAGVHDPLFARVLVIDNGRTTVAIVSLDLIETGGTLELRERIQREIGIPINHIVVTASHDHSAPRLGKETVGALTIGGGPEVDVYTVGVNNKIVAALKRAKAALQPAVMGIGTGRADVNVNRDLYTSQGWKPGFNPNGPSDKTVWVLKFDTPSGEPIAILFNYAVHSVVTLANRMVSGDLAGATEHYVEQRYGDKVVALWTLGAAGDQNPKFAGSPLTGAVPTGAAPPDDHRNPSAYEAMNAQGFMLGAEVVRVADLISQTVSTARIEADERVFSCPFREGIKRATNFKDMGVTSVPIRLGLILIDQIALATVSGEVVTNIDSRLKRASPLTNTIMVTLTNDRVGYLVDDASYDTSNFEVLASPAARGCAEDAIVNGLVELINQHR